MKGSQAWTLLATVPCVTSALSLGPRSIGPRVVGLDIERRNIIRGVKPDRARLSRRDKTVSVDLNNQDTLYYANLSLGTPAQNLQLHIDTGSSDLWVNTAQSRLCSSQQEICEGGTYDASSSSSSTVVNNDFNITYLDGSGAIGDYVTDTLHFGGITLDNFQFGVGESSTSAQGVLGVGYTANEVQASQAGGKTYPNLPQALLDAGHINSNAYSLWLNDLDANTGMILFGGVNTAKYEGDLATVPILKEYDDYYEFIIALTGVEYDGKSLKSDSLPAAALLDSGSTVMYLPDDMVETIYNDLEAVVDSATGQTYAYCDDRNADRSMTFSFSGQTIKVPFNELFLEAGTDSNGDPLTFDNGRAACLFGIAPAGGTTPVLGDTFLRSAYVVYDLQNNEISLAQTRFNATDDDIREITRGDKAVPGATPVANPVTSVVTQATGGARLGGTTATATGLSDPNAAVSLTHGFSTRFVGLVAFGLSLFLVL